MSGPLAALWEGGYLAPIDRHFAAAMVRLVGRAPGPVELGAVELGAALASRAVQRGHVCLELAALAGGPAVTPAGQTVEGFTFPTLDAWRAALTASPLVTTEPDGSADRPLVLDGGDRLYLARYWSYQRHLAAGLLERAAGLANDLDGDRLRRDLQRFFPEFDGADPGGDQRRAARMACERQLAVISGGPGTGKTFTVVRIMALLFEQAVAAGRQAPRFALLAPTGKAAARLAEAVRAALDGPDPDGAGLPERIAKGLPREASTLHRALGFDPARPTRFRHDAQNPLAADVVVVDEASMVDLALMAKLIDAVPASARLILLGDRDQLASVEAGAILGDVCPPADQRPEGGALAGCVIELGHSWRFGDESAIGRLARAINAGDAEAALALLADERVADVGLLELSDPTDLAGVLAPLIRQGYGPSTRAAQPDERQHRFDRFRVLAALRSGPAGVAGLNGLIERALGVQGAWAEGAFYPGRPIMVTRNDYGLGLFNGDVGMVQADGPAGHLRATFPGRAEPVSVARLPACETAFALTAHKSQGSEFDELVLVLPPRPSPVVTRELVYTAVTRARQRVTLVGSPAVLRAAIQTPVQRASGLRELLWGAD